MGDSPAAVIRWRYYQSSTGAWVIIVDRLVTLNQYKARGLSYRLLYTALQSTVQYSVPVEFVEIIIPSANFCDWSRVKLGSLGFAASQPLSSISVAHQSWAGAPVHIMQLAVAKEVGGVDQLLGFLMQKCTVVSS